MTTPKDDAIRPSRAARRLRQLLQPVPPMNQTQLAAELGVTQQAVSSWLRGILKPSEARRARIEEVCGIPASEWLQDGTSDESGTSLGDSETASGEHAASKPTGT